MYFPQYVILINAFLSLQATPISIYYEAQQDTAESKIDYQQMPMTQDQLTYSFPVPSASFLFRPIVQNIWEQPKTFEQIAPLPTFNSQSGRVHKSLGSYDAGPEPIPISPPIMTTPSAPIVFQPIVQNSWEQLKTDENIAPFQAFYTERAQKSVKSYDAEPTPIFPPTTTFPASTFKNPISEVIKIEILAEPISTLTYTPNPKRSDYAEMSVQPPSTSTFTSNLKNSDYPQIMQIPILSDSTTSSVPLVVINYGSSTEHPGSASTVPLPLPLPISGVSTTQMPLPSSTLISIRALSTVEKSTDRVNPTSETMENIPITKFEHIIHPDMYLVSFETGNGIKSEEQGYTKVATLSDDYKKTDTDNSNLSTKDEIIHVKTGEVTWISPECRKFILRYQADENGYKPSVDEQVVFDNKDCLAYIEGSEGIVDNDISVSDIPAIVPKPIY